MCLVIVYITFVMQTIAATISLSQIPVGKVVSVNGLKFVKIAGNQYLAAAPHATMQGWDGCAAIPTPTYTAGIKSTYFTQGPILMDARDGKKYEIRKFPDGKCWMVDNLAYGGTTTINGNVEACAGKATFVGEGQATPYVSWYQGSAQLYGDCRDPHVGGQAPCAPGGTQCGYYYNWQATMQLPSAYYGINVTYPAGTPSLTNYIQGICPDGWHVPSGGETDTVSEFVKLDKSVGGDGTNGQTGDSYINFWKSSSTVAATTTDPWKGVYSGYYYGGLAYQADQAVLWTSTQSGTISIYYVIVGGSVHPQYNYIRKNLGFSIRCIKN
jgi:uncharacterized protein (TIGR02145 family)